MSFDLLMSDDISVNRRSKADVVTASYIFGTSGIFGSLGLGETAVEKRRKHLDFMPPVCLSRSVTSSHSYPRLASRRPGNPLSPLFLFVPERRLNDHNLKSELP